MTSSKTSTSFAALRLLGVTVALALLVAVVPASSKADTREAPRRATEAASAPSPRNAAKLGKAVSRSPFRSVSELRSAVAGRGTVRVIVGFDAEFAPEGELSAAQASAQRAGIKSGRQALLAAVAGTRHKVVRKFKTIPYVALEVSAASLARLEASGVATSISEDVALPPTLAQSVPLIQGDDLWAAGFDGTDHVVAVLDTGVESSHSFLTGKVVDESCFSANGSCPNGSTQQFGAGAGQDCDYADGCLHGTHVAGIAAGTSGSFSGVARGADIAAVQVFSEFTGADCGDGEDPCALSYSSDQIAGLEHVLDLSDTHDIASANLSLGGGQFFLTCDYLDPAYQVIIGQLRSLGIATVIATGNEGFVDSMGFPACLPNAISVSSTDKSDAVSVFANNAFFTSLMAPGGDGTSTGGINSSVPGNAFAVLNGTSMATPHVAGAWALMHDVQPASVFETLRALQATGKLIPDATATIPRINVFDAAAMLTAGTTPGLTLTGVSDAPDPFTPKAKKKKATFIEWTLSHYSINTKVKIQKKSGKLVKLLVNRDLGMGPWFVKWNGKNKKGKVAKAGTYKYVISAMNDDGQVVKKTGTVKLKR
ncbi:MAG: S8 family serine peptidase [Actinobacteria bacterium]|nr:S8 family serine peptidase [Actinomycetota bacterium]